MLHLHRSERADHLVEALGDLLADPPDDPMVADVVAVPTRGVERWLTQRLSHRLGAGPGGADGVCANVEFPFPGTVVGAATAAACGVDPDGDPWPPQRSVWPLLDLVDAHLGDEFLAPLATHLRAAAPAGEAHLRRFAAVRHVADLYDRYGVHRPDMVLGWASGDDGPECDDRARAWQPQLWRRLREAIGVPSPAERFTTAAEALATDSSLVDLPPRLSLFGLTRLPASYLMILKAIATGRDVHLFLLHPSGELWGKVAASGAGGVRRRVDDPTSATPDNPLLRSWGRDSREMQLVLAGHGAVDADHRPVREEPVTLLRRIQGDIRADRSPAGLARTGEDQDRPLLEATDDSLRVHSCHGRARQVDVMRDAVAHLLNDDPTLEPRDVIVMCPDVEAFAPLIHAAFDPAGDVRGEAPPGPEFRVRLADRSLRQTNPLLAVAALLVDLAGARVTASEVLDLASAEPVRRRFRFDDEDLGKLERWVGDAGIRWGIDGEHRAPWKLAMISANTWAAGLDRLMLGVAMAEEDQRLFGGTLPVDDIAGTEVELAGRFAEMLDRLVAAHDTLQGPRTAARWAEALTSATESVAVAAGSEQWQHEQLRRLLAQAAEESAARPDALLDRSEVRSLLGDRLRGRPTRANFRTGDLTVCTLVPMRSVPHRVVCLLGLDDGVFPRHTQGDGDNLLLVDPRVGDSDPRSEDRQLLLDAVLAATDHLIVTYAGRDERTNQTRPPAVPVAELLDVVDRTVRLRDGRPARRAVVVVHPLQPFDRRNFTAGALNGPGPWSFDPVNLQGARALAQRSQARRPFLTGRLPALDGPAVELEALVRFVQHPVKEFLRERLGVYLRGSTERPGDAMPLQLDPLEEWTVGDRLLTARLAGADAKKVIDVELARGDVPPGPLAAGALDPILACVDDLVVTVKALPASTIPPDSVEATVRLPDGRLLLGTVPGVRGDTVVNATYSRLDAKHRLAAWVRFLALSAARPELAVSAVSVGRGENKRKPPRRVRLAPLAADAGHRASLALQLLQVVVDLYDRGMREPLPLFCKTSAAWAAALRTAKEPVPASRQEWERARFGAENTDEYHSLVYGERVPLDLLLGEPPREDESGHGWREGQDTRIGRLACRLWDELLAHEERSRS